MYIDSLSSNHNSSKFNASEFTKIEEFRMQATHHRRLAIIRVLSLVLLVTSCLVISISLWLVFSIGSQDSLIVALVGITVGFLSVLNLLIFARSGVSPKLADLAATNLIYSILVGVCFTQFVEHGYELVTGFFLIPILAGILNQRLRNTIINSVLAGVCLILTLLIRVSLGQLSFYSKVGSDFTLFLFNLIVIYTLVSIGTTIFIRRGANATLYAEEQSDKLRQLVTLLDATNSSGFTLSHELSGITAELDVASHQQATGTQEQVAAITQVTSSLEELSESANRIALNAKAVVESANKAVATATEVKHASQLSQTTAGKGNEAVEQAINSVQRMRYNIEQMASRLLRLTEQTNKVGKIVELINGIAEETHLLALNASIEAVGSLDGHGRSGARFGVIALEVKNLADRSKDATQEIRETIAEMQNAVAAAVLTAEEGRKETFAAVGRSQLSGEVIQTLTEVISDSYQQADQILEVAQRVKTRCEEISLATNQQRSANQQILATMREIGRISFENAGSVSQLAGMAVRVNKQVERLNLVLQEAS